MQIVYLTVPRLLRCGILSLVLTVLALPALLSTLRSSPLTTQTARLVSRPKPGRELGEDLFIHLPLTVMMQLLTGGRP